MKITESKGFSSPNLPARPQIKHHTSRLAFNFSFLTNATQYNLKKNNKNVNNKIRLKLLEKIATLSEEDKVLILNRPKDQGLELLPEEQVKLRINQEFKDSGRYEECDDNYWVFRLSKKGRVIGKISDNIFYILAVDPKFDLYKH
ncbi:hypothetical protein EFP49_02305 [Lactobacillus johnsonii]|uniref:hypothetical protein n=1 Tax=Lactobacillus johnsonii TaxID=33959 RepID=UPI0021A3AEAD|nr:hypothetical protein [Lactobacillus johnsonii]MCT3341652.1 hypothetical protein [Lactobacillus johnsonii]